jgi:hypothetical protein
VGLIVEQQEQDLVVVAVAVQVILLADVEQVEVMLEY